MNRLLYTLAVYLLLPLAPLYLLQRGRRQPEYRLHWNERFARYADARHEPVSGLVIWIHAVSVGETRAAQPLLNALAAEYPARFVMTHMTPTGRATAAEVFGTRVTSLYLPYDTPGAVRRFLDHVQPTLGIVMETELWPNLLHAARLRALPVVLANARLSTSSAAGYARFASLSSSTLQSLAAICAQSTADASRLRALGARDVTVTGSVKFDITPPESMRERGQTLRGVFGSRPVVLCASTREGEEALLLQAWKVGSGETANRPLLVLVPRHPQRFDAVAALIADAGLRLQRRSENAAIAADTDVVLGDSMGEMFAYYAAADVAFVGGSLLDFGCQNLIEPCAVGTPVLLGPSTFNFADAASEALASGAARQAGNATELVRMARGLLTDHEQRIGMAQAGLAFTAKHTGATERTLEILRPLLSSAGH